VPKTSSIKATGVAPSGLPRALGDNSAGKLWEKHNAKRSAVECHLAVLRQRQAIAWMVVCSFGLRFVCL